MATNWNEISPRVIVRFLKMWCGGGGGGGGKYQKLDPNINQWIDAKNTQRVFVTKVCVLHNLWNVRSRKVLDCPITIKLYTEMKYQNVDNKWLDIYPEGVCDNTLYHPISFMKWNNSKSVCLIALNLIQA